MKTIALLLAVIVAIIVEKAVAKYLLVEVDGEDKKGMLNLLYAKPHGSNFHTIFWKIKSFTTTCNKPEDCVAQGGLNPCVCEHDSCCSNLDSCTSLAQRMICKIPLCNKPSDCVQRSDCACEHHSCCSNPDTCTSLAQRMICRLPLCEKARKTPGIILINSEIWIAE